MKYLWLSARPATAIDVAGGGGRGERGSSPAAAGDDGLLRLNWEQLQSVYFREVTPSLSLLWCLSWHSEELMRLKWATGGSNWLIFMIVFQPFSSSVSHFILIHPLMNFKRLNPNTIRCLFCLLSWIRSKMTWRLITEISLDCFHL